jgi:hypothetical protein
MSGGCWVLKGGVEGGSDGRGKATPRARGTPRGGGCAAATVGEKQRREEAEPDYQ